jgi:hypothetical protein
VTAEVQKKGLNNSSLLNLLGIIRIKANYAMVDNKILIETAVRSIRQEYGPSVARDVSDALQGVEMELRKSTKTISAKDRFGKDYCVVPQE